MPQLLDVPRRQPGPIDLERQLVELAGKPERHLVVCVVHRRAGIGADVKILVPWPAERDGSLQGLTRHFGTVDLENAGAAAADAANAVEGERGEAEAVIFEVELKRVL